MAYIVLVVDDSPAMRSVIKKTILASGIDVEEFYEAADGVEALAIVRHHRLDIILTDFNMPHMDGMELLQELKKDDQLKAIPVVVTSVEGSRKRVDAFTAEGAVGYIKKPFTPEEARDKFNHALGVNSDGKTKAASSGESLDF
jgi:two-component system chemotaxis response regulator CheY